MENCLTLLGTVEYLSSPPANSETCSKNMEVEFVPY